MNEMSQSRLIWIGWIVIVALALWLRINDLEGRPIHADEATGARILAQKLESQSYRFDPQHFHGPLLSVVSAPIAVIRNENSWTELSLLTLRISPVIAGMLTVLAPLLWLRRFGGATTLAAAALLASSPLLVYYNRMFIHESWLLLFGILTLASLHRLAHKPSWFSASLTGLCIGLMFAAKETFAISIIAWAIAGTALLLINGRPDRSDCRTPTILFAAIAAIAFATSSFFYSDGFRNWLGVLDSVKTFFVYEITQGHEKPAGYYLHTLFWPKQALGIWWTEICILLLAAAALMRVVFQRSHNSLHLFLALATLVHFVIYSWIDYKTPWLMLLPWGHACLLAGLAFNKSQSLHPTLKTAFVGFLISTTIFQTHQSLHATGRYANDERNPYAYVPTSRNAEGIAYWLQQLNTMKDAPPLHPIAVIGKNYWPLPWYLREFESIGYWNEPHPELSKLPIIIAMPEQVSRCDALWKTSHQKFPKTLRTNVPVMLYLRKDIWNQWIHIPSS